MGAPKCGCNTLAACNALHANVDVTHVLPIHLAMHLAMLKRVFFALCQYLLQNGGTSMVIVHNVQMFGLTFRSSVILIGTRGAREGEDH